MFITKLQLQAGKHVATNEIRPALASIHFDGKTATATDSYRMIQIINNSEEVIPEAPVLLKGKETAKVKFPKALTAGEGLPVADGVINAIDASYNVKSIAPSSEYPDFQTLLKSQYTAIDTPESITFSVNARFLRDLLETMEKVNKFSKVSITVQDAVKGIVLVAEGEKETIKAVLMPLNK